MYTQKPSPYTKDAHSHVFCLIYWKDKKNNLRGPKISEIMPCRLFPACLYFYETIWCKWRPNRSVLLRFVMTIDRLFIFSIFNYNIFYILCIWLAWREKHTFSVTTHEERERLMRKYFYTKLPGVGKNI